MKKKGLKCFLSLLKNLFAKSKYRQTGSSFTKKVLEANNRTTACF